jgi:hypothetical protein
LIQDIIAPEASKDLEEISAYYAIQNIEAGEKLISELAIGLKFHLPDRAECRPMVR